MTLRAQRQARARAQRHEPAHGCTGEWCARARASCAVGGACGVWIPADWEHHDDFVWLPRGALAALPSESVTRRRASRATASRMRARVLLPVLAALCATAAAGAVKKASQWKSLDFDKLERGALPLRRLAQSHAALELARRAVPRHPPPVSSLATRAQTWRRATTPRCSCRRTQSTWS